MAGWERLCDSLRLLPNRQAETTRQTQTINSLVYISLEKNILLEPRQQHRKTFQFACCVAKQRETALEPCGTNKQSNFKQQLVKKHTPS